MKMTQDWFASVLISMGAKLVVLLLTMAILKNPEYVNRTRDRYNEIRDKLV